LVTATLVAACAQLPPGDETLPGAEAAPSTGAMAVPTPVVAREPVSAAAAPDPATTTQPVASAERPPAAPKEANPPPPPINLWQRIRSGFRMPDLDNPLVREWETWYSSRPDYVARMVERSSRILFHVVEEVERRNMPAEIALLPMIESAYNPQAYSRAHASGMWQFIPSTAKLYGLNQNWWYDGRRDIVAATNAALDYLEKLHGMFGSWELALASYNWGEGAVSRAIARNQAKGLPTDYESLAMPAETRNYLPKLQAVKNIIADPARFGLQLADVPNESYFATVTAKRHIDVELAARFAEIPIEEFRFLNPAHNKLVINANSAETIVLPKRKVETFLANLAKNSQPLVSWEAYTVKPGERPEKIAAKHGISLSELKQINGISGRKKIATGQPLLVPVRAGVEPYMPNLPASPLAMTRTKKTRYVPASRRGAILQKAAQRHVSAKKPLKARRAAAKRVKTTIRVKPSGLKKVNLASKARD
jgi:membrane-bound lytic murein transglycosylase D